VICRHDPSKFTPDEVERATWLLHGHWHGDDHRQHDSINPNARAKLIDCGIDALRSLSPVRLSEVIGSKPASG
jgi:calcineurin-like phosphoesterase family protein